MKTIYPPSYLFVELTSLDDLCLPFNTSSRVKYTCLDAGSRELVFGTTSGSIYCFGRYATKHKPSVSSTPLQVIAAAPGPISLLRLSPDERFLAACVEDGSIYVISLGQAKSETLLTSSLHQNVIVTSLCWTLDSCRLFAGDASGRVSVVKLDSTFYFRPPTNFLMQLDGHVVQLDCAADYVLVSTVGKSYLYNTTTDLLSCIGSKLRNGLYGACFLTPTGCARPVVFCSRPGARLWEADCEGKIYSTHDFSRLTKVPFAPVVTFRDQFEISQPITGDQSLLAHFTTLCVLNNEFLCTAHGSCVYVVVPQKAQLVLMTTLSSNIVCYACCDRDVFLLLSNGSLRKLCFYPAQKAACKLLLRHQFRRCAELVSTYYRLKSRIAWPKEVLDGLASYLEHVSDVDVRDALVTVLNQQRERAAASLERRRALPTGLKLNSGIHKVLKPMENSGYEDDFCMGSLAAFKSNKADDYSDCDPPSVADDATDFFTASPELQALVDTVAGLCAETSCADAEVQIERVAVTESECSHLDDEKYCTQCGLHRSWSVTLKFGFCLPIGQCQLNVDYFDEGGIPATFQQWSVWLDSILLSNGNNEICHASCDCCAKFVARVLQHFEFPRDSVDLTLSNNQCLKEKLADHIADFDIDKRSAVIGTQFSESKEDPSHISGDSLAVARVAGKLDQFSLVNNNAECGKRSERSRIAASRLPLHTHFWLMRSLLGTSALLDWVATSVASQAVCLPTDAWSTLCRLVNNRDAVSSLNINSQLICSLTNDTFEHQFFTTITAVSNTLQHDAKAVTTISRTCSGCTLPLTCVVSSEPSSVLVFMDCGHGFHSVCVPLIKESKVPGAIMCPVCTTV